MEESGAKVKIVILDACRNNPFERSWTRATSGKGLATMNAPSGTIIAYSTAPGTTASDGSGNNSLYTSAMLENIIRPNIPILQMFQYVRANVSQKSSKQQIPWESTSLTGDFYFNTDSNLILTEYNQSITVEGQNDDNNQEFNINIDQNSSSRNIKITKVFNPDSLNNSNVEYYVTLNKGLNSRIRPKNHLDVYSSSFVKSNISGESLLTKTKRVGNIIIMNSFANISEGKLTIDKGINFNQDFNQNLSYARKKSLWSTIYVLPRIKIVSKEYQSNGRYAKSTIGLGYAIYSRWLGIYTEISPFKYLTYYIMDDQGDGYRSTLLASGGFITKIGQNTGFKLGASNTLDGEYGWIVDFGMINSFSNNLSIVYGLSAANNDTFLSFGMGYSF